jgi:hypothetical protein
MIDKIKPYLPWLACAVAVGVAVWLAVQLSSARSSKDELGRVLEFERIQNANLIAELQKTKSELKKDLKELLARNSIIKEDFDRLEKEVGNIKKVSEIIKAQTKPATAGGVPRPDPDKPLPKPGEPVEPSRCLLAIGDTANIEIDEVTVVTKEGNHVVLGSASAWRLSPEPRTKLFESGYSAKLTTAEMELKPPPYTWGGGVYVGFSRDGVALGLAGAFPTFTFFDLFQVEIGGGVGMNPYNFTFQGGVMFLGRFR